MREPPKYKDWETIGSPKLLAIGNYLMGFDISPKNGNAVFRVFIDYDLPTTPMARWLGYLLAGFYAKWCVQQMVRNAQKHFTDKCASAL